MPQTLALKESTPSRPAHKRHQPETTILYRTIDEYYPEFRGYMAEQGRSLPLHVQKEFDEYLNVVDWSMGSFVCNALPATMNGWLRSADRSCTSMRPRH